MLKQEVFKRWSKRINYLDYGFYYNEIVWFDHFIKLYKRLLYIYFNIYYFLTSRNYSLTYLSKKSTMKNKLCNYLNQLNTVSYLLNSIKLKIALSSYIKIIDKIQNKSQKMKNIIYFYAYKLHFNLLLKFSFNIIFYFLFQLFFNFSTFHEVFASETVHNANDHDEDHNKTLLIILGFGIILAIGFFAWYLGPDDVTDIPDPEPFNAVDAVLRDIPPYLYP